MTALEMKFRVVYSAKARLYVRTVTQVAIPDWFHIILQTSERRKSAENKIT